MSWYNLTRYCIQFDKFEGKNLARLWTLERHPYLALTGELWLSIVSCWGTSDLELSVVHGTVFSTGFDYIHGGCGKRIYNLSMTFWLADGILQHNILEGFAVGGWSYTLTKLAMLRFVTNQSMPTGTHFYDRYIHQSDNEMFLSSSTT